MKRRKGVTVFSVLALTFVILAAASYVVVILLLGKLVPEGQPIPDIIKQVQANFDIIERNKDIIRAFQSFDNIDLVPHILAYSYIGLFVILTIIWLIVDLKRDRKICFFFITIFLLASYASLIYDYSVLPVQDQIRQYADQTPLVYVPLGGLALPSLAYLFSLILFIVDVATGTIEKQEKPTFIKEPTEEIEEGFFEEVKDENEVEEKKEETAPLAANEVEEEVEEEEKPAPKKAASKKTVAKKAEAKKPAPKKEKAPVKKETKKPEPKKEAKKPEPKKEDARKTQTILLTNESGNTYAKAFHVSRRPELNKWQVKATGSDKALKLFNTQKEAIEYANQLAKNQNVSVRVHSKEGKIRKHNG